MKKSDFFLVWSRVRTLDQIYFKYSPVIELYNR